MFAVWFTYGADSKPTWFVLPGGSWDDNVFTGSLYATTSAPWVGVTYDPTKLKVNAVGSMSLKFVDQDNLSMTYTVNGVTQTKAITRQPF